jgi:rhodanese-related sulfurtransferase
MNPRRSLLMIGTLLLFGLAIANVRASLLPLPQQDTSPVVERISAEELKTKLAGKRPLTIIDVRASNAYVYSDKKIKGAIRVKLRRLHSRLALPPLRDIPRDREVITYCACPNEETSIRAAQVLLAAGFKQVRALKGGWNAWLKVDGQLEAKPKRL